MNRESVANQTVGPLPHLIELDELKEGPAMIRNRLVERVETDWVLFLDDDDWLEYDYYETVEPFLNDENDVVYTWCKRVNLDVNLDYPFNEAKLRKANYIPVTACVKVDTFKKVGGFPLGVGYEDWALWVAILDVGGKFHLIRDRKWTYRRHDGSRTYENQRAISSGEIRAR